MNSLKRKVVYLLVCVLLSMQIQPISIYAEEVEWYEMVEEDFEISRPENTEIQPYTMYIMDVITSITKISTGKVGIRADIPCSSTVSKINVTIYLQKKVGSSWTNVGSQTLSASNVSSTTKKVTVSGLSSGTYRGKVSAKVTDKYGYTESASSYSGSISI